VFASLRRIDCFAWFLARVGGEKREGRSPGYMRRSIKGKGRFGHGRMAVPCAGGVQNIRGRGGEGERKEGKRQRPASS
jgi:hypothetical protein